MSGDTTESMVTKPMPTKPMPEDLVLTEPMPTEPMPEDLVFTKPMPAAPQGGDSGLTMPPTRPMHTEPLDDRAGGLGGRREETAEWAPDDIRPDRILASDGAADESMRPTLADVSAIRVDRDTEPRVGSSASVYRGVAADGTPVAVKRFHQWPDAEQRARREWRAARVDLGPHVVRALALHRTLLDDGTESWVLVMNYVGGGTLAEQMTAVERGDEVDADVQRRWLHTGLEALALLEDRRHLLCDIKPANIGLTSTDRSRAEPVLLDQGAGRRDGTVTGAAEATLPYAAPEYLAGAKRHLTPAADLFSFGVSLLDVFTGGRAFDVGVGERAARTLTGRPRLEDPRVAPVVASILRGMLVRHPEDRPSAAELLECLDGRRAMGEWDADTPYFLGQHDGVTDRPAPVVVDDGAEAADPRDLGMLLPLDEDLSRLELRQETPAPLRGRWLQRFAGVNPRYVTTGADRTIYNILGVLLIAYFVYAVAATVVWTRIVTDSGDTVSPGTLAVGVGIGVLVAAIVVSWDRSIVALPAADLRTVHDARSDARPLRTHWVSIAFRVLFALLFAALIGEAANQAIFAKDVSIYLQQTASTSLADRVTAINAEHKDELAAQDAVIRDANAVKATRQKQIDAANAAAEGERTGTSGTGEVGCGQRCNAHLDEAARLTAGQAALDAQQDARIAAANTKTATIQGQIADEVATAKARLALNTGPIAREKALWSMLLSDGWMLTKYIILTALLLMLEMAAVIIKLSTRGNNYELQHARALRHRELIDRLQADERRALAVRRSRENAALVADIDRRYYEERRREQ